MVYLSGLGDFEGLLYGTGVEPETGRDLAEEESLPEGEFPLVSTTAFPEESLDGIESR
jgi:hypothetical protein